MKYGLSQETIQKIKNVFAQFKEVNQVIIYGSRARGTYKDGSDIDLTLKGTNLNLTIMNKILNKLDDLLLPYTFDLSIFETIENPDLIDHIKRVGEVFLSCAPGGKK